VTPWTAAHSGCSAPLQARIPEWVASSLCKHCVMIFFLMFLLQKPKEPVPTLAPKTLSVAAAFNEDEDVS